MKTLYDLLGALPDDDAEGVRQAFRKAVKASHPDINTGDPDAPLRFRQIVRANEILSDAQQRATYDRLLALTVRRRPGSKSRRSFISDTMYKIASDAIAVAVLSVILTGGYLLFAHLSKASVIPDKVIEVAAPAPVEIAAVAPAAPLETTGRAQLPHKLEAAEIPGEAVIPAAVAPAADTARAEIADAGPATDLAPRDAKSYRERGIFAYRDGDLPRALANFDLAIQHDPGFADAYIDRSIVFYRMHQSDRAFADIAQAKRIESSNRTRTPLPGPHQAPPSSGKN
jgi:curved DNA-binding protein CbpA